MPQAKPQEQPILHIQTVDVNEDPDHGINRLLGFCAYATPGPTKMSFATQN